MKKYIVTTDDCGAVNCTFDGFGCKSVDFENVVEVKRYNDEDAWKLMQRLNEDWDLRRVVFNCYSLSQVFDRYDTYEEAKKDYDAWMSKIDVGDEIIAKGTDEWHLVVTRVCDDTYDCVRRADGRLCTVSAKTAIKTGKYFPEIAEIFKP